MANLIIEPSNGGAGIASRLAAFQLVDEVARRFIILRSHNFVQRNRRWAKDLPKAQLIWARKAGDSRWNKIIQIFTVWYTDYISRKRYVRSVDCSWIEWEETKRWKSTFEKLVQLLPKASFPTPNPCSTNWNSVSIFMSGLDQHHQHADSQSFLTTHSSILRSIIHKYANRVPDAESPCRLLHAHRNESHRTIV